METQEPAVDPHPEPYNWSASVDRERNTIVLTWYSIDRQRQTLEFSPNQALLLSETFVRFARALL